MSLEIDPRILAWCQADPERFAGVLQELREGLIRNRCVYNGEPVRMSPVPLVLEPEVVAQLEASSAAFSGIIDHVIGLACREPEVGAWFNWAPPIGDWARADCRGAISTAVSRFDALLTDEGQVQYLEFNTDNPGGKSWNHGFNLSWMECGQLAPFLEGQVESLEDRTQEQLYQTIVREGRRFFGHEDLCVAFIDILDESGINEEHHLGAAYLRSRGLRAIVHDARQFELRDGKLFADGEQVHVVYRGMQAYEFTEYHGLEPLLRAYLESAALFLNSFRAILGSQKSILAFISDPANEGYFDQAQRAAIEAWLPWTTRLSHETVRDWEGRRGGLEALLRGRQAELVLKPSSGSGGRGVVVGGAVDAATWEASWHDHLGNAAWVVQRYVPLQTVELPVLVEGRVELERKYVNINPYVLNGAYAGTLARYSDNPVINVESGGGVLPVFHRKSARAVLHSGADLRSE